MYEAVSELCKQHGVSIYDLEREAKIGNGTIGKWRDSGAQPNLATLKKISDYFGITLGELMSNADKTGKE